MRSSELLSKDWCDLLFANRNQEYGAYSIRRDAGIRYRYALIAVIGMFVLLMAGGLLLSVYVRKQLADEMKNAERALAKLKVAELKQGYEVKFVATARLAPSVCMALGAAEGNPVIVSGKAKQVPVGIKSQFTFNPEQDLILSPVIDTIGLNREDLPMVEEKIMPTEEVAQMPQFPGGPRAFMKWLDTHIIYPRKCINFHQHGDVTFSFIVGTDGYVQDLEVKGAFDPQIRRTMENAFNRMPKWTPGVTQSGVPTPVRITVPVHYRL